MPAPYRPLIAVALGGAMLMSLAVPASAQRWGGGGWGPGWGSGWGGGPYDGQSLDGPDRSREGKITVARFVSKDPLAAGLGRGAVMVGATADALDLGQSGRTFAAAISERLAKAGYAIVPNPDAAQTQTQSVADQVVELTMVRTELEPQGPPHKKVSGEADVGVSNRGSGFGLAIAVDLRKPTPPLINTRLQMRIRDRATGTVLWEGRAEVATRAGAKGWTDQQMATRLAAALLDGFPRASDTIGGRG